MGGLQDLAARGSIYISPYIMGVYPLRLEILLLH